MKGIITEVMFPLSSKMFILSNPPEKNTCLKVSPCPCSRFSSALQRGLQVQEHLRENAGLFSEDLSCLVLHTATCSRCEFIPLQRTGNALSLNLYIKVSLPAGPWWMEWPKVQKQSSLWGPSSSLVLYKCCIILPGLKHLGTSPLVFILSMSSLNCATRCLSLLLATPHPG